MDRLNYARLMITQVEGARGERRYRSDLFDKQRTKWERAARDYNDLCESRADLIRRGVQPYALGEINAMIECTSQIAEKEAAALRRAEEDVDQLEEVEREAMAQAKAAFNAVPRSSCSPIDYANLHADIAAFI